MLELIFAYDEEELNDEELSGDEEDPISAVYLIEQMSHLQIALQELQKILVI